MQPSWSAITTAAGTEDIRCEVKVAELRGKEFSEIALHAASIPHMKLLEAGLVLRKDLGSGNQSSVHSAWKIRDDCLRCIKRFSKATTTPSSLEFLKEEYRIMVEVGTHPCVTQAFQIFQDDSFFYIELPLYRGGDFSALKQNAVMSGACCDQVWWTSVFQQALRGLAHLHSHDFIHCDVKEPNLMVKTENYQRPEVVLIDFGIAQAANTKRTTIYGTPGYIAPEVWDTKTWTPKGDAFSLGVVIVQIMTGKVPDTSRQCYGVFTENTKTLSDIKWATKTRNPDLRSMIACGKRLQDLTEHLLMKDVAQRTTVPEALAFLESESTLEFL
jgi:serine/threonine protein kinase